jgi:predicted extracellular nuclease
VSLRTATKQHIHVLVNHWPSRRGGQEQTNPLRATAARVVRRLVDSLHRADPEGLVVVMGDFNDRPADAAPAQILQSGAACLGEATTGLEESMNQSVLYNPFAAIDLGQMGSYRYKDEWQFIDHISISHRACSVSSKIRYVTGSAASVLFPYMLETEGKYAGNPLRTYGGEKYLGGYSDHLPVKIEINIRK